MTDIYPRGAATALRLLTKYGVDITFRSVTAGAYDTSTGQSVPIETDTTRKAAFFDVNRLNFGQMLLSGTQVQQGDRRLILDANGSAPSLTTKIIFGGASYAVIDIKELNPAGTPVLYDLIIRK